MWAEARKQEKKVRGIMVDHKKRAERRREYYEKIVRFPISFLFFFFFFDTNIHSFFRNKILLNFYK